MTTTFPDTLVPDREPLVPTIQLPDPADRHVVAAAWTGRQQAGTVSSGNDGSRHRNVHVRARHPGFRRPPPDNTDNPR